VIYLGRRFVLGDLLRGFARTVGRTSRLSVAVRPWLRELGPYTAIALLLPGGSLIALAAWALRRRPLVTAPLGRLSLVVAAFCAALILPGNI
jgi:uncharacterized membrane protein